MCDLLAIGEKKWDDAGASDLLAADHQINEAKILFPKIEDEEIEAQIKKLNDTKTNNQDAMEESTKTESTESTNEETSSDASAAKSDVSDVTPVKSEVAFDDFMKMSKKTQNLPVSCRTKSAVSLESAFLSWNSWFFSL